MPTLKSGNGELEGGSPEVLKSPGFLTSAMNKAGAVLGIIGTTVATDAIAQQAPNNLAPKVATLTAPAVPGTVDDASQIPTGADVISILQNGKDKLKSKFSSFNDVVFARIVGEISLGSIKPETLAALAGAFPEGSKERNGIMKYSETLTSNKKTAIIVATDKPPINSSEKLPPLNETKEQKAKRETIEKLLKTANKGFFERDNWKIDTSKGGEAEIKVKKGLIETRYKGDAKKIAGQAPTTQPRSSVGISIVLAPGTYKIDAVISGSGQCVIKFYEPGNKDKPINNGGVAVQSGENIVTIPAGLDHQFIEIKNNALENGLKIEKFEITSINTDGLAAK